MAKIIGICGGSGSGKTFLANELKRCFGDDATLISFDNYGNDNSHLPMEDRKLLNYDTPQAYDGELLAKHVLNLKCGKSIEMPIYDFSQHTRIEPTQTVNPGKIIIIEGIMTFCYDKLNTLYDLKIFVDADEEVRFKRRLKRDVAERGRTPEYVNNQFHNIVAPMHNLFVEPKKSISDYIVRNSKDEPIDIGPVINLINNIKG